MEIAFNQSGQGIHLSDTVVELAATFTSNMMDAAELAYLAAALSRYPWDGKGIVVEIGAYRGSTSVFMAKVLQHLGHRVPILSIDPFERVVPSRSNPKGTYAAYLRTVRKHQVGDVCLPLVAFSKDASPVVPDTIGVLVVDGGHEHAVVSRDLHDYAPKVLPGGLIFIDDYIDAYPGVTRAVDDYFVDMRPFAIVHKSYFVVAQRR
jgi:predicted O-methyltransferase YrrM